MRRTFTITIALCLMAAIVAGAWGAAQNYKLQRGVLGSAAGDTLQGTGYCLNSIVGQPVVGESSAPGSYSVVSGYSTAQSEHEVYLPLVLRDE